MAEQQIQPDKITKPIQLLAAWLIGLIVTNTLFLGAAANFDSVTWERGALVIAAIVNVPVFLLALFLLQTRFRAELQEDSFYSEYLSKKTAAIVRLDKNASQDAKIEELELKLTRLLEANSPKSDGEPDGSRVEISWSDWLIAINELHPRFSEMRQALRIADIPVAEIFSSPAGKPSKWIVAINYRLPIAHKVKLLKVVLPFGFEGIQFWDPERDAGESEDVYIGAYGAGKYAPVKPELLELLEKEVDAADLNHYFTKYSVDLPE